MTLALFSSVPKFFSGDFYTNKILPPLYVNSSTTAVQAGLFASVPILYIQLPWWTSVCVLLRYLQLSITKAKILPHPAFLAFFFFLGRVTTINPNFQPQLLVLPHSQCITSSYQVSIPHISPSCVTTFPSFKSFTPFFAFF